MRSESTWALWLCLIIKRPLQALRVDGGGGFQKELRVDSCAAPWVRAQWALGLHLPRRFVMLRCMLDA